MKTKTGSRWILLLPFFPVVLGLCLLVIDSRLQQAMRVNLFDQYQRWQPREYAADPVRIVDIDEASLARLGQWPWPRTRLAELLDKLMAAGAGVVAFDMIFAEPDQTSPRAAAAQWQLTGPLRDAIDALPDHDRVFAASLARANAVLGIVDSSKPDAQARIPDQKARFVTVGDSPQPWLPTFSSAVASLPALELAAPGNGVLSFVPDGDGVVRRVPLVMQFGQMQIPSLASEVLRVAKNTKIITIKSAGQDSGLQEVRIGDLTIPTTAQGEIWVHYTKPVAERYVPAWQVLTDAAVRERLAGKIILVGSSAQGLLDLRFSPFGLLPGVEVHAQVLEQMLSGHFLARPGWARGAEALTLMIAGLAIGFLALRAHALVAAGACTMLLAGLLIGGWQAFAGHGLLLDVATPAIGILLTFVICSLAHHFASEREQRWIKEAFSRYVSPNRVSYLVEHPEAMELGGRRQECSFIFTDLADFTTLIERIDPGASVAMLNAYLDKMIAIVFKHEGTLDRIVGDALVVMFSAPIQQPDHKQRAYACALEMDAFASHYSAQMQARGIAFGKTRIGVHAGAVTVGNFGGSTMFDYRALGDPINAAARLESVNKHLGTRMCISEAILAACPDARVRPVGRLVLKGKTRMLAVYEPFVAEFESAYAPLADYVAAFAALRNESADAPALFDGLAAAYPGDPLVALHHRRLGAGEQGDLIVMHEK